MKSKTEIPLVEFTVEPKAVAQYLKVLMLEIVFITLVPALIYVHFQYRTEERQQIHTMKFLEETRLAFVSSARINTDITQVKLLMNNMQQMDGISAVELYKKTTDTEPFYTVGAFNPKQNLATKIPMQFFEAGKTDSVGFLSVYMNQEKALHTLFIRITGLIVFSIAISILFFIFLRTSIHSIIEKQLQALSLSLNSVTDRTTELLLSVPDKVFAQIPDKKRDLLIQKDGFSNIKTSFSDLNRTLNNALEILTIQSSVSNLAASRDNFLLDLSYDLPKYLDSFLASTHFVKRCTPFFSDWCIVDLRSEAGSYQRIAVAHKNTDSEKILREKLPLSNKELLFYFSGVDEIADSVESVQSKGNVRKHNWHIDAIKEGSIEFEKLFMFEKACNMKPTKSLILVPLASGNSLLGRVWFGFADKSLENYENQQNFAKQLSSRLASSIEISRLYEKSQASNRAKDNLLQMVSHELRTPLTAVIGWSSVLKEKDVEPSVFSDAIDRIEKNAETLLRVIDNLIDASAGRADQLNLNATVTNISPLVKNVLLSFQDMAAQRRISFQSRFEIDSGTVLGDSDRLAQVFSNLIGNAIKFSENGGVVQVSVRKFAEFIEVNVSDQGKGIKIEFLSKIFGRFTQQESGLTRSFGGLGLGLSLSYDIVTLHGGTIRVYSDGPQKGSIFSVRLPSLEKIQNIQF
jgi:signal transduction histidine kinase